MVLTAHLLKANVDGLHVLPIGPVAKAGDKHMFVGTLGKVPARPLKDDKIHDHHDLLMGNPGGPKYDDTDRIDDGKGNSTTVLAEFLSKEGVTGVADAISVVNVY